MRAHSLCRVRQRVRKSSRVIVYSFAVTAGVEWVSLFLSLFRCSFAQTTTLLNRELTSVSFSKSTLTSFLSPLPPTTPDISVFLPDSGRCELAVRQRFVGRSDPGVAALDQETSGSAPSASTSTRCTHVCRRSLLGAVYHGPSWSETWVSFATTKQRQLPVDPGVIGPAEL